MHRPVRACSAYANELLPYPRGCVDRDGHKHPLALIERATENAAVVQALIDNLIEPPIMNSTTRKQPSIGGDHAPAKLTASGGGQNRAKQRRIPIHPPGAPSRPRSIQDKLLSLYLNRKSHVETQCVI
jgi:hypothetical protein